MGLFPSTWKVGITESDGDLSPRGRCLAFLPSATPSRSRASPTVCPGLPAHPGAGYSLVSPFFTSALLALSFLSLELAILTLTLAVFGDGNDGWLLKSSALSLTLDHHEVS